MQESAVLETFLDLEEQGWRALSTQGDAGKKFYGAILREDAAMLFPGGLRIEGRDNILESLGAQPWQSFRIDEPKVVQLSEGAVTLIYRVTAQRHGGDPYRALVSSTYVLGKEWQLAIHQQTPVEG